MAALGLTFGQLGITSTVYSGLRDLSIPSAAGQRVVHAVVNSTFFPLKEMGHQPSSISATLNITAASVAAFVAVVRTGTTERKISFMLGATECYVYAYSGDVGSVTCVNPYGTATRLYDVAFTFPLSRSKVYLASDDTTLWGS